MSQTRLATVGLATLGILAALPPAAGVAAKPVVKTVRVQDEDFAPTKVTIKHGSEVKWAWSSQNFAGHNVTLLKGPKGIKKARFTSVTRTRGFKFERIFTTPGTYQFVCTIHPWMNMTVVVKR
jgi:plastocyanin